MEITINFSELWFMLWLWNPKSIIKKNTFQATIQSWRKFKDFSRTSPTVPYNSRTFQDGVNTSLKSLPLLNFVLGVVALANMQKDKNHI